MGTFDDAKVVAYEDGNYRRLKRHDDAVRLLDVALKKLDGSMRRHRCTDIQYADTIWRAKRLVRPLLSSGGTAMRQLWQEVLAAQAATAEV